MKILTLVLLILTACGSSHESGLKIVGGRIAGPQDVGFKNAVAIKVRGLFRCTGSLIKNHRILSAAHCFDDIEQLTDITVVFGASIEEYEHERVVTGLAVHENFDFPNYDVATLSFDGAPPNGYVPYKLHVDKADLTPGRELVFAGFGVTRFMEPETAGKLRIVTSTLHEYRDDERFHGLIFSGPNPGKGICSGDSGGPVYLREGNSWVITGINTGIYPVDPGVWCRSGSAYHNWTGFHNNWLNSNLDNLGPPD